MPEYALTYVEHQYVDGVRVRNCSKERTDLFNSRNKTQALLVVKARMRGVLLWVDDPRKTSRCFPLRLYKVTSIKSWKRKY